MIKNVVSIFLGGILFVASLSAQMQEVLNEVEAEAIAIEAYIYGYPLITMDMTRRVMTNVSSPTGSKAPMGQFANARTFPNASFKDVTAPNADTLYSTAWLNLSEEPYVLHLPDMDDRYYLMPMLSGWTNVFTSLGTRTTGNKGGNFAITGPNWKGALPEEVQEVKSPTDLVWILGRTYSKGTAEDYKEVYALQDQYILIPLSHFGKPYNVPKGIVDSSIDMLTPVREQVNKMTAETYFKKLAQLLKENPPASQDASMIAKMEKIGIVPGNEFDLDSLDQHIVWGLKNVPKRALEKILSQEKKAGRSQNGWIVSTATGDYGTDYLQRAYIALIGLGANLPEDAIYPFTQVDSQGNPLTGDKRYIIHFDKGQTPPVKGFWSLTIYNDQFFFVENPLNRFNLNSRNNFRYNPDGSLDLFIQNRSPGKENESNWLPAPSSGKFILMFRFYWPEEQILKGAWQPPAVQHVDWLQNAFQRRKN